MRTSAADDALVFRALLGGYEWFISAEVESDDGGTHLVLRVSDLAKFTLDREDVPDAACGRLLIIEQKIA